MYAIRSYYDAIGIQEFVERAEGDGVAVPDNLKQANLMIRREAGQESYWDLQRHRWQESTRAVPKRLDLIKQSHGLVDRNNFV